MRAGFLIEPRKIELREIETPGPLQGEVLVKIKAALTCGTDLKAFLRGHPMIPMPGVFGHEFSGIIVDIGKGVKKFREGDAIMAVHSAPCLNCRYCKKKLFNLCENIMNSKVMGAFAEYILLPEHVVKQNLFHKPATLRFEEAAFLEPLSCVVHGMSGLNLKKKDTVLIIGAGPIGLLHLLTAKSMGSKVIITGLEQERLKLAKALGADVVLSSADLMNGVKESTGGIGADFLFECTGQLDVWEKSVNYVRRGGTVVLFGGCKAGTEVVFNTYRLHYDEITLKGTFHFTPQDVRVAYRLLKNKKIKVSRLITKSYPLNEIFNAFESLAKAEGIKYAIRP